MPSRWIRDTILTSERLESLGWAEQSLFQRLILKCDDYGLYDGRTAILRATLYPLKLEQVSEADIEQWLSACAAAGVVALYSAGGKPFVQALRTRWQARSEPKFPLPPWGKGEPPDTPENNCQHRQTTAGNCASLTLTLNDNGKRVPSEPKTRVRATSRKTRIPDDFSASERVQAWATANGYTRLGEHVEYFVGYAVANGKTYADWDQALMNAIRNNWAKLGGANGSGNRPGRDSGPAGRGAESTRSRSFEADLNDRSWADAPIAAGAQ